MDKPVSLSVRDYLTRKMAVKLMVSEKTIDAVVAHMFNSANRAMYSNDSVEISGFGKLLFNKNKAKRKLQKLYEQKAHFEKQIASEEVKERVKHVAAMKLSSVEEAIDILSPRITDDVNRN